MYIMVYSGNFQVPSCPLPHVRDNHPPAFPRKPYTLGVAYKHGAVSATPASCRIDQHTTELTRTSGKQRKPS